MKKAKAIKPPEQKPIEKPPDKKQVKVKVEKDQFGFTKGSKSSAAIKMMADGKTPMKDVRKQFKTLSFSKLLSDLKARGWAIECDDEKCTIIKVKG